MKARLMSAILLGLIFTGCIFGPAKKVKTDQILARVDNKVVLSSELDSMAEASNAFITDTTDVSALKTALLDSLIDSKLIDIRIDSVAGTLENDRDFLSKREDYLSRIVFKLMFDGEITPRAVVDSAEIQQYYKDHPDLYTNPEQIKAAHILVRLPIPDTTGIKSEKRIEAIKKKNDDETKARAEAICRLARQGDDWDSLVVKYSQDQMNNGKGGDLGYFPRGRMVPAFDSAAFSADIGQIVGPIKTIYGYHIIKIEDRKPAVPMELNDDVRNDIKTKLQGEKQKQLADQFMDSLKAEAKYVYNDEALAKEDSLVDPGTWILIVNDIDTVFEKKVQESFPKYRRFKQLTKWTIQDKKDMLKDISITYLLEAAGKVLGYYNDPKVLQESHDQTYKEAELRVKHLMRDLEYQPTEDEIEQYYNDHFDELYKEKKPLHVQHIIFADSATALAVRDSILAGADFKDMALRYYPGEPEIREVAYDLGYISDEELGKRFYDYANSLQDGEVSLPFKTEWGYHLIKLVNRREDKKLSQVKPGIRKALIDQTDAGVATRLLNQWRAEAQIAFDNKAINKYQFPENLRSVQVTPGG